MVTDMVKGTHTDLPTPHTRLPIQPWSCQSSDIRDINPTGITTGLTGITTSLTGITTSLTGITTSLTGIAIGTARADGRAGAFRSIS